MVDQELEEGLRSVAAPIRDRSGRVTAAVNLGAHASRTSAEVMRRELLPPLLATAARIEADLHIAANSRALRLVIATRARARAPRRSPRSSCSRINLRTVLASFPPLVPDIRADLGLSATAAGPDHHAARAVHGRVRAAGARGSRARVPDRARCSPC